MTTPTDVTFRRRTAALAGAVALLLLAGGVALGTTMSGEDEADVASSASSTTGPSTTAQGAGPPTTGAPAAGSGDAAGTPTASAGTGAGGPATTQPAGQSSTQPPGPMPAVQPPAPGNYRYRVTAGDESREFVAELVSLGSEAGGTAYELTTEGERGELKQHLLWRNDGVTLRRTSGTGADGGGGGGGCDWEPDVRQYAFPLSEGAAWTGEGSCTLTSERGSVTIKQSVNAKVTGRERLTIGGEQVDAWIIEGVDTTTIGSGARSAKRESRYREWFSPAHGLMVKRIATTTAQGPENSGERSSETLLLSLRAGA